MTNNSNPTPDSIAPLAENAFNECEEPQFSFFLPPVNNTTPFTSYTLFHALCYITGNSAKSVTEELRTLSDPKEKARFKREKFAFCTFSGQFSQRSSDGLIQHSGFICLDLDHLAGPNPTPEAAFNTVYNLMDTLSHDTTLKPRLIFRSPSGDGLKVVVAFERSAGSHQQFFSALAHYFESHYHIAIDRQCSDIARACFLPHDPCAYFYPLDDQPRLSSPFLEQYTPVTNSNLHPDTAGPEAPAPAYPVAQKNTVATPAPLPENESERTRLQVEAVVQSIESAAADITADYTDWCKIGLALQHTFGEEGRPWFHRLSRFYPAYDSTETDRKYTHCAQPGNITIASFFAIAKAHGFAPPRLSCTIATPDAPMPLHTTADNAARETDTAQESHQLQPSTATAQAIQPTQENGDIMPLCWTTTPRNPPSSTSPKRSPPPSPTSCKR